MAEQADAASRAAAGEAHALGLSAGYQVGGPELNEIWGGRLKHLHRCQNNIGHGSYMNAYWCQPVLMFGGAHGECGVLTGQIVFLSKVDYFGAVKRGSPHTILLARRSMPERQPFRSTRRRQSRDFQGSNHCSCWFSERPQSDSFSFLGQIGFCVLPFTYRP